MRAIVPALILALGTACSSLPVDRSTPAVDAGDYTLILSACQAVPGGGMDVCHVRAGAEIDSAWKLHIPQGKNLIEGGEVNVYFRDIQRSYPVSGPILEIPWRHFFYESKWSPAMDGEALALVTLRWKTPEGVEEVVKFRGIAKIVVTKEGYDRLPIDSGLGAWKAECQIEYTTSGRSAISCK